MESGAPLPSAAVREEATICLSSVVRGDPSARDRLFLMVLAELRSMAQGLLRQERREHTLQATALVHEAYVRLIKWPGVEEKPHREFLGVAAAAMREVLVDHARRRMAEKRGGGLERVELTEDPATGEPTEPVDVLKLSRALDRLRRHSEGMAKLVDLRYFAGLDVRATAEALGVSVAAVGREWRKARAFLQSAMDEEDAADS